MSKDSDIAEFSRISKIIFGKRWHYFNSHVEQFTPFIRSVYKACLELKVVDEKAPLRMLREICNIGGKKNFEPHYDQLLQKLAEIMVMHKVVKISWPVNTSFRIESGVKWGRKKVDFVAALSTGQTYGFEVKAPQYSTRTEITDNLLRSYLRSANKKFAEFKELGKFTGILVIVWDGRIEDALSPLFNEQNGLLTPTTYSKIKGEPETFPHLDSVIILPHLDQLANATTSQGVVETAHIDAECTTPNFCVQLSKLTLPDYVKTGFSVTD